MKHAPICRVALEFTSVLIIGYLHLLKAVMPVLRNACPHCGRQIRLLYNLGNAVPNNASTPAQRNLHTQIPRIMSKGIFRQAANPSFSFLIPHLCHIWRYGVSTCLASVTVSKFPPGYCHFCIISKLIFAWIKYHSSSCISSFSHLHSPYVSVTSTSKATESFFNVNVPTIPSQTFATAFSMSRISS